ncbi:hypothetical protein S7711_08205 [Stachybotrys chartarum IBT 7711]|uniref:Uncharacterized protein n=1 Tax=Stachybotrys chartarum (strain CBS 109288 / IBT 7711) TaxID=1280523 RepID=A0A084AI35_STACB|nr:hypothetical protein S7711_08205 [Stachybotrys chartarum IBT 7711]KFA51766.1 hypothetical protein S40293_05860 [Stachybotrys chartarum IBT 40293]KFA79617.1 hypothetical protein S40288_04062 [Stachybotrys chartarum IBT 40288]
MHAPHYLTSLTRRFSRPDMRTAARRSSSTSSSRSSYSSTSTVASSPLNAIVSQRSSILEMEEERRDFPSELNVLEPRPVVYWGSVEERISFSSL